MWGNIIKKTFKCQLHLKTSHIYLSYKLVLIQYQDGELKYGLLNMIATCLGDEWLLAFQCGRTNVCTIWLTHSLHDTVYTCIVLDKRRFTELAVLEHTIESSKRM